MRGRIFAIRNLDYSSKRYRKTGKSSRSIPLLHCMRLCSRAEDYFITKSTRWISFHFEFRQKSLRKFEAPVRLRTKTLHEVPVVLLKTARRSDNFYTIKI
jgi:hypothetical protein